MTADDFPPSSPADDESNVEVSKTQLKREAAELVDLAKAIANLSNQQLEGMPLDDALREAFEQVRGMRKGPAIKRQFKFIGKLLRETDVNPIREALARQTQQDRFATARLHHLEQWRDRLIEEGDTALGALLDEHPQADRQHLRQLIRQAQAEQAKHKPPAASRKLFKYLRALIEAP